ncbi:MAG: glycoside hydrolase family 13 protein [Lachnospiraceae bacterium]|nr:glycoside hydrolase family 13 protein [Lachnospiraceae bacterium]
MQKWFEKNKQYIQEMRPVLNRDALFSDTGSEYVIPSYPEAGQEITIRFRTAACNVDRVFAIINGERLELTLTERGQEFDFYELKYRLGGEMISYYFEVWVGRVCGYYDVRGLVKEAQPNAYFKVKPGFSVPDWAKGAVMYQIFVDRFYNGDPSNDVETGEYYYIDRPSRKAEDWNELPAASDVSNFHGGDLKGVLDKLDYLQDLGVEVLYLSPIFVSPSNHKYDIQDYDHVDPHYGVIADDKGRLLETWETENTGAGKYINRVTNPVNLEASNDFFADFVKEVHKRGMKVILDGVFNHCGSFNKWMDRECIYGSEHGYAPGAYVSADSPYRNFFTFHTDQLWPHNGSYEGWWGYNTLPKLNYEGSQELEDYILHVGRKWVSAPYNADGWRLDVAADLGHSDAYNHSFWKKFRKAVKEANPDALILAEHYGDASEWLKGDEWDSVMNYDSFMEPLTWFLTGMEKHSDDFRPETVGDADLFWKSMAKLYGDMESGLVAMNELSNHDHSRFLTRTSHKVGRIDSQGAKAAEEGVNVAVMREAVAVQMTWPGAPTVYYGDEAGLCGFTDPDNRRAYPWGHEDQELIRFHKEMIRIHKENQELKTGSLKRLNDDKNYLAYGRFDQIGAVAVLVNHASEAHERTAAVWELGLPMHCVMERLMLTFDGGFTTQEEQILVENGNVRVWMPPYSVMVLKAVLSQGDGAGI